MTCLVKSNTLIIAVLVNVRAVPSGVVMRMVFPIASGIMFGILSVV